MQNLFSFNLGPETYIFFSIIAKGASGGHGRLSRMSSHGAVITAIVNLKKDEELCIVVGHEGESACVIEGVSQDPLLDSQVTLPTNII